MIRARIAWPDVLLTDVVMPGMRGPDLARAARELCPDLAVIYMSGYVDLETENPIVNEGDAEFLAKPFRMEGLRVALQAAVRRRAARTGAAMWQPVGRPS